MISAEKSVLSVYRAVYRAIGMYSKETAIDDREQSVQPAKGRAVVCSISKGCMRVHVWTRAMDDRQAADACVRMDRVG